MRRETPGSSNRGAAASCWEAGRLARPGQAQRTRGGVVNQPGGEGRGGRVLTSGGNLSPRHRVAHKGDCCCCCLRCDGTICAKITCGMQCANALLFLLAAVMW